MKRLSILRLGAAGLAALVLVGAGLVAVALTATPALADTSEPPLISGRNASDPEIQQCSDAATGWSGLCMFTSNDLTASEIPNPPGEQWWYPMDKTYLYTLDGGEDPSVPGNWEHQGVIFDESQIEVPPGGQPPPIGQPGGFVPDNALHLWAPTHMNWRGLHYLLVPDVSNMTKPEDNPQGPNLANTGRIAVARSPSLFGDVVPGQPGQRRYTYQKTLNINDHASDPTVGFREPLPGEAEPTPYLAYADGDGTNCGGLKIVELNKDDVMSTAGAPTAITINGLSGLGSCTPQFGGPTIQRPYLEGPALYYISPTETGSTNNESYYLIFAAYPQGQPGVIAYATASDIRGPYNYRGVIMGAANPSTEWTNHASIQKWGDHWVFAYHDGPDVSGFRAARETRAACLTFRQGKINPIQRTGDGFARCMAVQGTVALRSRGNGLVVTAESGGAGELTANRGNIGLWERFDVVPREGGRISLRAHANNKYVTTNGYLGALTPDTTDINAAAQFALIVNPNGSVYLQYPIGDPSNYVAPLLSPPAGSAVLTGSVPRAPRFSAEFDIVPLNGFLSLRAKSDGQFVTAPNGSQSPLVASGGSGTTPAWAETFSFSFETSGFGRARLQWTAPLPFVCADSALGDHEHRPLIANKLVPEDCVTFTLLWNTDGTFSLQSAANGRFVAAPPTSFGGPLVADRTEIHPSETSWEKFDLVSTNGVVW